MYSPARGSPADVPPGGTVNPIDVVAGLIVYGGSRQDLQGSVLVAQRRADDSGAGFWEFPGGKVEKGESLQEALRREIQEELEMEIQVLDPIADQILQTPTGKWIRLTLLAAKSKTERFELHDHDAALWVPRDQLQAIQFLDGNKKFFPAIQKYLNKL